jgi:hypothetical protein
MITECGCIGDVPMWVEPEDLTDHGGKRLTRRDTFVPSPKWLFDIYPGRGRSGVWSGPRPAVVAGHLIELGGHHQISKQFVLKMLNWYVPWPASYLCAVYICSVRVEQFHEDSAVLVAD